MKIIDTIQGSPEWFKAREGIPTASCFKKIITPKTWKLAEGRHIYGDELLEELVGASPRQKGEDNLLNNPDVRRGKELEPVARRWLAMELGTDVRECGFCLSDCGRYGASVDGFTEDDIPVEIKVPRVSKCIRMHRTGEPDPEYIIQSVGHVVVTGAPYCWLLIYSESSSVPHNLIKVDNADQVDVLRKAVEQFCDELAATRNNPKIISDPAYHE